MELLDTGVSFDAITVSMKPEPDVVAEVVKAEADHGDDGPSEEKDEANAIYIDDLVYDKNLVDLPEVWFDGFEQECVDDVVASDCLAIGDGATVNAVPGDVDPVILAPISSAIVQNVVIDVNVHVPGLRELPDPQLLLAGKGKEKQGSEHNDMWARRWADSLRSAMKWDMTIPLGDLPFSDLDELFSNFFSRAVKVKGGGPYPSETLMNIANSFNRILRRASDIRALNGVGLTLGKAFNIISDYRFTKTRLVLKSAVTKSAREGVNKKRKQVITLTNEMEAAILTDVDHQIGTGQGCQKRLAFFCLVRLGIRGGVELWQLKRKDLQIKTDKEGRDYVLFEERESKNNSYTLERYKHEQFRKLWHSYEDDFVLCLKQYLRHMPAEGEGTCPDLFLGAITNPVGNVWYNRAHKVSKDRASKFLKTMLALVGLEPDLFSNRSGRATLVTRMASSGVPDEVGMMITGHHSLSGYSRYDRTENLKMKAATLVSANPELTYEAALTAMSKKFMEEEVIGNSNSLKPLVERVSGNSAPVALKSSSIQESSLKMITSGSNASTALNATNCQENKSKIVVHEGANSYAAWNQDYDGIDWELALRNDHVLAKALGRHSSSSLVSVGSSVSGNTFSNCQVHITVSHPSVKESDPLLHLPQTSIETGQASKENVNPQK